jgi:hypothetical protein
MRLRSLASDRRPRPVISPYNDHIRRPDRYRPELLSISNDLTDVGKHAESGPNSASRLGLPERSGLMKTNGSLRNGGSLNPTYHFGLRQPLREVRRRLGCRALIYAVILRQ